jgi:hypothetical protein
MTWHGKGKGDSDDASWLNKRAHKTHCYELKLEMLKCVEKEKGYDEIAQSLDIHESLDYHQYMWNRRTFWNMQQIQML